MRANLLTIIFFVFLLINISFVIASDNVYSMPIDLPAPIPYEQKIPIPNQTNRVVPIGPGNLTIEIPSIEMPKKVIQNITINLTPNHNQSLNYNLSFNQSTDIKINITPKRISNATIINISGVEVNENYTGTASAKRVEEIPDRGHVDLSKEVKVNSTEIRIIRYLKSDSGPLKNFVDILKEISNFMRDIFERWEKKRNL